MDDNTMDDTTQKSESDHNVKQRNELLPAVADYLQTLNEQALPAFAKTGSVPNAINAREGLANLTRNFVTKTVSLPLIVDDVIPCDRSVVNSNAYDVPVRLFYPNRTDRNYPLPVMVYFHGGGGTAGSVSVYQQILCRLAHHTGHIVVAPEYRLAPENPYPCAQNDALTVLIGLNDTLKRHDIATTNSIVVAGDSHGGALVSNLLRDPRLMQAGMLEQINAQVLIYPSVDFTMSCPSIETYANGYLLSKDKISWYFQQYFQHGENRRNQSALFASQDEFADQPPALIINAAMDPLHDEGASYAKRLSEAGIDTKHICFDGVIHAYLNMEDLNPDICQQTYQAIAEFLNQ